jgi:hypothetical protein
MMNDIAVLLLAFVIDYRCEDVHFPVSESCVSISSTGSLSRSETDFNSGKIRS